MELRIKTTTYGDDLKKFEIVEKHSIRIFGKVIAEWYTPFEETSFYQVQSHIYSRISVKALVKRHFEYYTLEEAEAAKRMFEAGPIKYRGRKIIPIPPPQGESSMCLKEPPAYSFISTIFNSRLPLLIALVIKG